MKDFFLSNKHFNMDMKNKLLNHNNDEEEIFNGSVREI